MNRRLLITSAIALTATFAIGLGVGLAKPAPRPAEINHVVFFKLKDPADTQALIRACDEMLGTIPDVASYYCGEHVDIGRAGIDSDYDVGFYVGFDDLDAYRAYLDHPAHVEAVNTWRPRWEWIRIYDVRDPTP